MNSKGGFALVSSREDALDPLGWIRAAAFLLHDGSLAVDLEGAADCIRRKLTMLVACGGRCCSLTSSAQCGSCGVSQEVALTCRAVLLSVNRLPCDFQSWPELELLRRYVRTGVVFQRLSGDEDFESRVYGLVGESFLCADGKEELGFVDWTKPGAYAILQPPCTWLDFATVLAYSGMAVYVPSWVVLGEAYFTCSGTPPSSASALARVDRMIDV